MPGSRALLPFPVVGIGASAGGIQALEAFFENVPRDTGMAFVVVQHLSPDHTSLLEEILGRRARIPVHQIVDGMTVEPNHVYVIAPGHTLTIEQGRLKLGAPVERRGHRRPVDDFFRSLAMEQHEKAIAVVLSGTGTNGTAGAQAIKAAGGICIAQQPESAGFPGDIGLAGEDGYSLIRHVRALKSAQRIAALAITAFARPEDRQRVLEAGFDEHLPKPVDPDRLIELAAKLATRH